MNKDDFSFENWGMAFNELLKQSPLGKSYLEVIENMLTENQKKDLYQV